MLRELKRLELTEVRAPRIRGPHQVLLQVAWVGVCGSDIHYYLEGRIGSQVVKYPFRLGHEMSAVVRTVGEKVRRVRPGDRVAIDPAISCGKCDQCRSGRRNTCRRLGFLGCPGQVEGCLAEFIVMPEECCFKVPAGVSLAQAALVEPLAIGIYAVRQACVSPRTSIAVLGCGPIGLSVVVAARAAGLERIYVTDKIRERLTLAQKAGACWVGNPTTEDVVSKISRAEPLLLDAVFECCGQQEALDQAVELLKPGGRLMLIGIPSVARVSFDIETLRRREICIQNVRRQNNCMRAAVALLAKTDLDFMITHRFLLSESDKAFETVANYADGVMKALIAVTGEGCEANF